MRGRCWVLAWQRSIRCISTLLSVSIQQQSSAVLGVGPTVPSWVSRAAALSTIICWLQSKVPTSVPPVSPPDQWPGDPGHSPPSSCRNKCGAGCTCNNVIGGDGERPGPGHTGSQGDYWTQCRSSANRGKIAVNPVPHWAAGSRDPGRCVTEMFNMVTHNSPLPGGQS